MSENNHALLRVDNLVKHFPIMRGVFQRQVGVVHAVDGITFGVYSGETFGLVGESGCGKSTAGRTILQLYRPTAGSVYFEDIDLAKMKGEDLRRMRRNMQMIFQDPYASLNPRMTVGEIIGEPLVVHGIGSGQEIKDRVNELLEMVRLSPDVGYPLPARIFRRAAPADRDCARPGLAAGIYRAATSQSRPWMSPSRRR